MPNAEKLAKKNLYFAKLIDLCLNTPQALLVRVDHVGSKSMQNIRVELRGKAIVLMGKNTMIRKALAQGHEEHPEAGLDKLRAGILGNIGFIFATACGIDDIKAVLTKFRVPAAAKTGQTSTCDLVLPVGPTGMEPTHIAFFQALNIATKIVKGQIELVTEFKMLKNGDKVSASAAILMAKLAIKPFEYGMEIDQVFQDASLFPAAVLEINDSVLIGKFFNGVNNMAAFSRELGIPTEAGLSHMIGNAFRNVASLVADADFTFKEVETVKKFLADPTAFAAASPAAAAPAAGGGGGGAAKKAAVVEEEEEEDMEFDLFG
jgi:large subunit ribosomal protein LP0